MFAISLLFVFLLGNSTYILATNEKKEKVESIMSIFSLVKADLKPNELLLDSRIGNILGKLMDLQAWEQVSIIINSASEITNETLLKVKKIKVLDSNYILKLQGLLINAMGKEELTKFIQCSLDFRTQFIPFLLQTNNVKTLSLVLAAYPDVNKKLSLLYESQSSSQIKKLMDEGKYDQLKSIFKVFGITTKQDSWKKYCFSIEFLKKNHKKVRLIHSTNESGLILQELIKEDVAILALAYHVYQVNIDHVVMIEALEGCNEKQKIEWVKYFFALQNELLPQNSSHLIRHGQYIPILLYTIFEEQDEIDEIIIQQLCHVKKEYDKDIRNALQRDLINKRILPLTESKKFERAFKLNAEPYCDLLKQIILVGLNDEMVKHVKKIINIEEEKIKIIDKTINLLEKNDDACVHSLLDCYKHILLTSAAVGSYGTIFDHLEKKLNIDPLSCNEDGDNIITQCIEEDLTEKEIIDALKFLIKKIGDEKIVEMLNAHPFKKNALCLAAELGRWKVVDYLLKIGANPCIFDHQYNNFMYKVVSDMRVGVDGSDRRNFYLNENEKIEWIDKLIKHVGSENVEKLFEHSDKGVSPVAAAVSLQQAKVLKKMMAHGASLHKVSILGNIINYIIRSTDISTTRRLELMQFVFNHSDVKDKDLLLGPLSGTSPVADALALGFKDELIWLLKEAERDGLKESRASIYLIPWIIINRSVVKNDKCDYLQLLIEAAKKADVFEAMFNCTKNTHCFVRQAYLKESASAVKLLLTHGVKPKLYLDAPYLKGLATIWKEMYVQNQQQIEVFNNKKMWSLMSIILNTESYKNIIITLQESGFIVPTDCDNNAEAFFTWWLEECKMEESRDITKVLLKSVKENNLIVSPEDWLFMEREFCTWLKTNDQLHFFDKQVDDSIKVVTNPENNQLVIEEKTHEKEKIEAVHEIKKELVPDQAFIAAKKSNDTVLEKGPEDIQTKKVEKKERVSVDIQRILNLLSNTVESRRMMRSLQRQTFDALKDHKKTLDQLSDTCNFIENNLRDVIWHIERKNDEIHDLALIFNLLNYSQQHYHYTRNVNSLKSENLCSSTIEKYCDIKAVNEDIVKVQQEYSELMQLHREYCWWLDECKQKKFILEDAILILQEKLEDQSVPSGRWSEVRDSRLIDESDFALKNLSLRALDLILPNN